MALQLQTPVFQINQLASKLAPQLKKLGIEIVEDLIFYYPFRHDDFSQVVAIKDLEPGKLATVKGKVELIKNQRSWKRRVLITESIISDQTGSVKAIWFGQPYVGRILKPGDEVFISGRVDQEKGIVFNSPSYEKITRTKKSLGTTHTARLVPIYNLTKGITSKQLRYLIRIVLTGLKPVTDYLPATIKKNLNFPSLEEAVQQIHFPDNQHQLEQAKKRLKFDEFFLIQLKNQLIRQELKKSRAEMIKFQEETVKRFVEQLPFKLTNAQRQAAWEILKDLARGYPMNRLLEGDVGSGKTVVAIIAMLNVVSVSQQAALMAPTEILARQHYQTVIQLLKGQGIKVGILTRSEIKLSGQGKITKKEILEKIKQGEVEIIIGTHALIQEKVEFNNLALAIIDEQHRFGVEQRRALQQESGNQQTVPHFLSMTATPIPRSLALTLYGDLDLSIIDQLPPGRKKVITKIVQPTEREQTYDFIKQEIAQGRQAFVICPLIDPSDKLGVRSVKEEAEKLNRQIFPELKIGVLHGRLKASQKEKIMQEFLNKEIDILVSTSVVEVGVDVPNATVMMIEGAERFGLAQLHQFRGRVGRSQEQSYCFLLADLASENVKERLLALVASEDGFKLAEKDLQFRGPGEVFGSAQSGVPNLKLANLFDFQIIKQAKNWATLIIKNDPKLAKYPGLKNKIGAIERVHLE